MRSYGLARGKYLIVIFCERLKAERRRLGCTGAAFAAAVGVPQSSQSMFETGKRVPDADYLMKACGLGADPAFLLLGVPVPAGALDVRQEDIGPLVTFHTLSPKARAALMAVVEAVRGEG